MAFKHQALSLINLWFFLQFGAAFASGAGGSSAAPTISELSLAGTRVDTVAGNSIFLVSQVGKRLYLRVVDIATKAKVAQHFFDDYDDGAFWIDEMSNRAIFWYIAKVWTGSAWRIEPRAYVINANGSVAASKTDVWLSKPAQNRLYDAKRYVAVELSGNSITDGGYLTLRDSSLNLTSTLGWGFPGPQYWYETFDKFAVVTPDGESVVAVRTLRSELSNIQRQLVSYKIRPDLKVDGTRGGRAKSPPRWLFELSDETYSLQASKNFVLHRPSTNEGKVSLLSAKTGQLYWQEQNDFYLLHEDVLYRPGKGAIWTAIDPITRKVIWERELAAPAHHQSIKFRGRYIYRIGKTIRVYNAQDGKFVFESSEAEDIVRSARKAISRCYMDMEWAADHVLVLVRPCERDDLRKEYRKEFSGYVPMNIP